jgi:hypothetical protein
MAEQLISADPLLKNSSRLLQESPLRRQLARFDRIQILDEERVRSIHTLTYEQASSLPTQVIEWDAGADMNSPRTQIAEVFDLSSATFRDDDGLFHPVPFLASKIRTSENPNFPTEIDRDHARQT